MKALFDTTINWMVKMTELVGPVKVKPWTFIRKHEGWRGF